MYRLNFPKQVWKITMNEVVLGISQVWVYFNIKQACVNIEHVIMLSTSTESHYNTREVANVCRLKSQTFALSLFNSTCCSVFTLENGIIRKSVTGLSSVSLSLAYAAKNKYMRTVKNIYEHVGWVKTKSCSNLPGFFEPGCNMCFIWSSSSWEQHVALVLFYICFT